VKLESKYRFVRFFSLIICLLFCNVYLWAGTTGKIAGRVIDANTGEGLPLVNIIIEETRMGAASDPDGYYTILNVPPGKYSIKVRMMGYREVTITEVNVSIDFTTRHNFSLEPIVIKTAGITVSAERPMIEVDLTSTRAVVDADRIKALPAEGFQD